MPNRSCLKIQIKTWLIKFVVVSHPVIINSTTISITVEINRGDGGVWFQTLCHYWYKVTSCAVSLQKLNSKLIVIYFGMIGGLSSILPFLMHSWRYSSETIGFTYLIAFLTRWVLSLIESWVATRKEMYESVNPFSYLPVWIPTSIRSHRCFGSIPSIEHDPKTQSEQSLRFANLDYLTPIYRPLWPTTGVFCFFLAPPLLNVTSSSSRSSLHFASKIFPIPTGKPNLLVAWTLLWQHIENRSQNWVARCWRSRMCRSFLCQVLGFLSFRNRLWLYRHRSATRKQCLLRSWSHWHRPCFRKRVRTVTMQKQGLFFVQVNFLGRGESLKRNVSPEPL